MCSEFYAGLLPFATAVVNTMQQPDSYGVFVCTPQCDYRKTITAPAARCVFLDFPASRPAQLAFRLYPRRLLRAIEQLCQTHSIDVIHLLTEDTALAPHLNRLRRWGRQVLYTVHDLFPHPAKYRNVGAHALRYLLVQRRAAYLIRHAPNLVTCSPAQYEWLRAHHRPGQRVFFHAFPTLVTRRIAAGGAAVPELRGRRDYILFFGRIEQYKGVEVLYQAYQQDAALRQWPLVIAGSGYLYFERDPAAEQGVVFINRYIADEEVRCLFARAACVVFPYTSATQSGVVSLAFYFGVPVIVSDVPFLGELVEDGVTGYTVAARDPAALAERLRRLLGQDPAPIRQAAAAYYAAHYGSDALRAQLSAVYAAMPGRPAIPIR